MNLLIFTVVFLLFIYYLNKSSEAKPTPKELVDYTVGDNRIIQSTIVLSDISQSDLEFDDYKKLPFRCPRRTIKKNSIW